MTRVTEAIYTHGVLKPSTDLGLHEAQRVRLIVEPLDEPQPSDRTGALKRLFAGLDSMQFHSRGRLPTRDELHDRI